MDTVSINEFRGSFREHVDKVLSEHEPLKVTGRNGADFMVIGAEDWEREQETLYVLGNRSLMEQITHSAQTHAAAEGSDRRWNRSMRSIVFEGDTWERYEALRAKPSREAKDRQLHRSLCRILKEMQRTDSARGIGKPEQLKQNLRGL